MGRMRRSATRARLRHPSFLPRLSFFVPFRVRNPLDENWNRELREQSRLFALQRKTTEGESERSAVVRIRLRRVISRRGRSEREPVKRNNASKIILLPVSVKRGIYLQISGELSRFYKAQNSIAGGNSTRMLHVGYSKGLATPLQPNKDMGHCCSTAHRPGRANHYLLQRALSVTERGNAK